MIVSQNLRPKIREKQRQCFHFISVLVSDKTYAVEVNLSPGEASLRSRRLEAVGEREKGRARGRHARGEGAPARKAPENRFNSHSVSADISNWSRGSPGKKLPCGARKLSINSTWTT